MNDSRRIWMMGTTTIMGNYRCAWWRKLRHSSREFVDWLELGPRVVAVWYPEGGYDS